MAVSIKKIITVLNTFFNIGKMIFHQVQMKKAHQDVFMKIFQPIQSKLTATNHYYSILIKPKVLKNGKSQKNAIKLDRLST